MARLGAGEANGTEAVRVGDRARCVVLLIAALLALALAYSPRAAAFVYWVDYGTIGRAGLDGSGVNRSFITPETSACGVAVDGAHVYWANRTFQGGTTIGRANLDGSGVDQNFITGADDPCGVAVDGAHVYWANVAAGTIGRANLDGSGVDQNFITGVRGPCGVAVDAAHVYWDNSGTFFPFGTTIGRANLDGSGVDQSFITGADGPCGVAVDAAYLYWANAGADTIGRANLDGSGVDQSFITGASGPHGLAVDSAHVYWSNAYSGPHGFFYGTFVARANLDGTCAIQRFILASPGTSLGVAVDAGGPQPSDPPPNEFSLGKARRNEKKGTAKIPVDVPGAGTLALAGKGIFPDGKDAAGAGKVKLPVKPEGEKKRRLNQKGEAKAKVEVTFTPTKGCPNTESKKIKLVKRH